jgi:hypothetical protein
MNCQLFETIINDLERSAVIDALIRDSALAHSEACERCAVRLRDERMLTAGLRRVAASAETKEAPAHVESALRKAFREQHSHSLAPVINQSTGRRWAGWAIATAATILILLALAALRPGHSPGPVENARDVKPEQTAPVETLPAPAPPTSAPRQADTSRDIREQQVANVFKTRRAQPARRNPQRNTGDGESKPQASGSEATEIATEFIPLVQGDNLNGMESGQIVRVELPRSALISFGLPMNMERADQRIKADVVLGNDGLARAIRFVN